MRRHLNTLYVTSEGAWLHKDGENVVVKVNGDECGRVPIHLIGGVVCFGAVGITPSLIGFCSERGVVVSLLTRNGRFLARIEGPVTGNVLLRRHQYLSADNSQCSALISRNLVTGKLLNSRNVVRRAMRDHSVSMSPEKYSRLQECNNQLTDAARRCAHSKTTDSIRGIEGEAARNYWSIFNDLLLIDDEYFYFNGRSRRPPLNAVNALLSFLYTLLVHDYRSALETVGLDTAVGFLHRVRPGRPSLALDLMEELRPVLAERLVLSLINRKQLMSRDFRTAVSGAVTLTDDARKTVLEAYQQRKTNELTHPFLNEKTTLGLVPFIQATLMARKLRGDLDSYPPFVWR